MAANPPAAPSPLPIYLSAATMFAAMMARIFLLPLRVHELGGSRAQVGLLATSFTITAAVLSLPAGYLSDRIGRRSLIVFSVVVGGASQLGLALSSSVEPMFFWQVLGGLGGGASQAALYAALPDVVPKWRLGRAYGWLTLCMQLGFLAGPAVSGLALNLFSLGQTLTASAALYAVPLVLSLVGVPDGRRSNGHLPMFGQVGGMVRRRGFAVPVLGLFAATLVWGTQQAYLPLFATEQLRLPETVIGYMIALLALANAVSRVPAGRLIDRAGARTGLIALGLAGYAVAFAVLPHLYGFWAPTALLMVAVPLMAMIFIATTIAINDLATDENRGVAMGVYSAVLYIGLGVGPAVFGSLADRSGYTIGFTACAATGLVLAGAVAILGRRQAPRLGDAPAVLAPPPQPSRPTQ